MNPKFTGDCWWQWNSVRALIRRKNRSLSLGSEQTTVMIGDAILEIASAKLGLT